MRFRIFGNIFGLLLVFLSICMIVPIIIDVLNNEKNWPIFSVISVIGLTIGSMLVSALQNEKFNIRINESFLITGLCWILLALFASLPIMMSNAEISYADSIFEAVSGITTTGSTVLYNLDNMPKSILIWRSMLQWLGGVGIVVMALTILPKLGVGGAQMLNAEHATSGYEAGKIYSRTSKIALNVFLVYSFLTLIIAIALIINQVSIFDAINHAMTSVATGGFSTHDKSIAFYDSSTIEYIIIIAMIFGTIPFAFYLTIIKNKSLNILDLDGQIKYFFILLSIFVIIVAYFIYFDQGYTISDALRTSMFQCTSIMTGTGYTIANYNTWNSSSILLLIIMTFIGGCAGSTACGIKIFRIQILYKALFVQLKKLINPNGIFVITFQKKTITEQVASSVALYIFVYIVLVIIIGFSISAFSIDLTTALSAAATAVSNVGPAFGSVGPTENFSHLPDGVKYILCLGMLMGRLEIYTILILFLPTAWYK